MKKGFLLVLILCMVVLGGCLIPKGKKIDAYDIGILVSLGIQEIEVYEPLNITILSTGDELIDFHENREGSYIRDINTYTLSSLAKHHELNVIHKGIIKDSKEAITKAVSKAMVESDIVILSGGSSKGEKDYTHLVFEELTQNVFTHGVSIKPGKPTILSYNSNYKTLCIGLPGHPLAAILMFDLIIYDWYLNKTHQQRPLLYLASIAENVSSNQERETCLLVSIKQVNDEYIAYPLYSKSGHISSLEKADGYVLIPRSQEGLKKGQKVKVEILQ